MRLLGHKDRCMAAISSGGDFEVGHAPHAIKHERACSSVELESLFKWQPFSQLRLLQPRQVRTHACEEAAPSACCGRCTHAAHELLPSSNRPASSHRAFPVLDLCLAAIADLYTNAGRASGSSWTEPTISMMHAASKSSPVPSRWRPGASYPARHAHTCRQAGRQAGRHSLRSAAQLAGLSPACAHKAEGHLCLPRSTCCPARSNAFAHLQAGWEAHLSSSSSKTSPQATPVPSR